MRILCAPADHPLVASGHQDRCVAVYEQASGRSTASIGTGIETRVRRQGLQPPARAWDLLTIALAITAADHLALRCQSPDGWTRTISLTVAVQDPEFWATQSAIIEKQLRFLTTDIWTVTLVAAGRRYVPGRKRLIPTQDSVVLLSGGLDSLAGAIDLAGAGHKLYAVSQVSEGDVKKQVRFASVIGGGIPHLQLNHNVTAPVTLERSQRARSMLFFAYGALAATSLAAYRAGAEVPLFVCENGFISLNPPLGGTRLGSLSTRTTHPVLLSLFQQMLTAAGLHVAIRNPYQFKTKGEMLQGCTDQALLRAHAIRSTSCGRYRRNGYMHCGRCVPCLIRRAAFRAWGVPDRTGYKYADVSLDDADHARYDDVRCAALALAQARTDGLAQWAGASLEPALRGDPAPYVQVLERGLAELGAFLSRMRIR
jgi:hypothetical protein